MTVMGWPHDIFKGQQEAGEPEQDRSIWSALLVVKGQTAHVFTCVLLPTPQLVHNWRY